MDSSKLVSTWSGLFGSPDNKPADAGRSLTSPAAYLADLLQLLDDYFGDSDFSTRRPDIIEQLPLNGEQSFSLGRQLDIVNRVLGNRVARLARRPAEDVLAEAVYPTQLPFDGELERIRQLLILLRTSERKLHGSFSTQPDHDLYARERLGLTAARVGVIVKDLSADRAALCAAYGLDADEQLGALESLERFRRALDLDAATLSSLLFAQLSQRSAGGRSERQAAFELFINHDLGGFVTLDAREERLVWQGEGSIPAQWFDRVLRVIRLSRWTGIDLISLDLALRQLASNQLDGSALRRLAVLVELRERTGASLEVLCALFAELDGSGAALGGGEDPKVPASLFDRVLNGEPARLSGRYLPSGAAYMPEAFETFRPLLASGDWLSDVAENHTLRTRAQVALKISAKELSGMVERFRERAKARARTSRLELADARSFSILHRVVSVAGFLDLPPLELLQLVDVLEKDVGIRLLNAFDILCPEPVATTDLYEVLEQGSVAARSWLIQNLVAIGAWAAGASLAPSDLQAAAIAPPQAEQRPEVLAACQALKEAFEPTALNAAALGSDDVSPRLGRVAWGAFRAPSLGLVSASDPRIVTWQETRARKAALGAIHALDIVTVEDLEALSLGEELSAHLHALLTRRGVLSMEGSLNLDRFPAQPGALQLEGAAADRIPLIFDFLHELHVAQPSARAGAGSNGASATLVEEEEEEEELREELDFPEEDFSDEEEATEDEDLDEDEDLEDDEQEEDEDLAPEDASDDEAFEDGEELEDDEELADDEELEAEADGGTEDLVDEEEPAEDEALAEDEVDAAPALMLYPSDLIQLGFEPAEADEVVERLTFQGVLDSNGAVRDPAFFADAANRELFSASTELVAFAKEIHERLRELQVRWEHAKLSVPTDAWDALPLTLAEKEALDQNLVFNGYLDSARRIVSWKTILALTPDTFALTLPLSRHRRAILAVLQDLVSGAKAGFLSVEPQFLQPVTDRIVALSIHRLLTGNWLDARGRINVPLESLASEASPLELGIGYSSVQHERVWKLLRDVAQEMSRFRLTDEALSSVGLIAEHAQEVIVSLCADGVLLPDRSLSAEQAAHFSRLAAAQDFNVAHYADYSRDVFFLVHDVALATQTAVNALTGALEAVAEAQQTAAIAALASRLELGPEQVMALLERLLGHEPHPVATLLEKTLRIAAAEDPLLVPIGAVSSLFGRLYAFASFVRKLRMSPRQINAAFQDQGLLDKFAEAVELPASVERIDVLWPDPNGKLYLFSGPRYWVFDQETCALLESARPLSTLSSDFAQLDSIDAIYTLKTGEHWLLAAGRSFRRAANSEHWVEQSRVWGRAYNAFENPSRVDGALSDSEGRVLLFSGDQFVRYSNPAQEFVDEGYPLKIAGHLERELGLGALAAGFGDGIDAAVARLDETTWLFKGDQFIASTEPSESRPIVATWGRVASNLESATRVDAVIDYEGRCGVVSGDQLFVFSGNLESQDIAVDPGFPRKLSAAFTGLPESFAHGLDAALTDEDGTLHLFCDQTLATRGEGWSLAPIRSRYGRVRNVLQETGSVDAALAGLDGKVYVFSGEQYLRYSGTDLTRADEGYPRRISPDWGGLSRVDAAFVLDGKTYLFGSDPYNNFYVRYSTADYRVPDEGYPKPTDDNWWNLPAALAKTGFALPDGVFVAPDGRVHLFNGTETISFDHNHRWWSEPKPIREAWSSLPFDGVSAGFTARDGRVYLFSTGENASFVRYCDPTFQRVDDRFPKPVKEHWGKLVNNLERSGRVDAAVTMISNVTEVALDGTSVKRRVRYRYLFSGDQFYRYSTDDQPYVDEGYPLRIQNNLVREPHFVNLHAPAERGVDGVWADGGNVLVFVSEHVYAASTAVVRELTNLGREAPRAADVEDGRLWLRDATGYQQSSFPEALRPLFKPSLPRALRTVPARFREGASAVLRGLDQNLYVFADGQCYDQALERNYPTGKSFGRVRNSIVEQERVDAALQGTDGKLYLFSGEQFVSYTPVASSTPPFALPVFADAAPASIAERFGGLSDVCHAFVREGVTYLLETPAADGSFRYVRYFGADYTRPSDPEPLSGDFSFWRIPAEYVRQGFDSVDAVLMEGEDVFLFSGALFLHYEAATRSWAFPRALSLRWPALSQHHPDFDAVRACFRAPDGQTYFFGEGTWLSHDGEHASALSAISTRWGRLNNRTAEQNRVDASVVCGDQTFLFAGDEYVRYTGASYQYVDAGYPRKIAGFLRQEAAFAALPPDIEISFERLTPDAVWVESAFAAGPELFIALAGRAFALTAQLSRVLPLTQLARIRNEIQERARVDAACSKADGTLFLLSGDQYVRYSRPELSVVDDGYPRLIADDLVLELQGRASPLPLDFQFAIDAALYDRSSVLTLFKGKQFLRLEPSNGAASPAAQEIASRFGKVKNAFLPSAGDPRPRIDAAFIAPDAALYVFKGGEYLRYDDPNAELVAEGYPRAIRDQFGDLPSSFELGIHGAFSYGGRTYLCREGDYVRYSDANLRAMDPSFPQAFAQRFRRMNDFSLVDLSLIERFVALDLETATAEASLTDFLLGDPREKVEPYGLLASLFECELRDVQWLKRRDVFLDRVKPELAAEVRFDLEQVLRLHDTLGVCRRLGTHPQELYEEVFAPLYLGARAPARAGNGLLGLLAGLYPGENFRSIERKLGDVMSMARRDALVAWLIAHSPEGLNDANALSDLLLTDVQIDASIDGSPVSEAIAAVQLYLHRYLTNLEGQPASEDELKRRERLKQHFRWLKNYRVWEANRKVFFYPESYIRPELRDTRTVAFKTLQDNLQQGEITLASVTQAYKKYLDEYTEVSRLIIAGGYVQPDPVNPQHTELTLFGATRTEPRRYYHRTATFAGASSTAVWRAWRALNIDISATQVYPVRAFGRTFVFWSEIEQKADTTKPTTLTTTTNGSTQVVSGEDRVQYFFKILYSFYDLSEQWSAPQTLGSGRLENGPIKGPRLRVTCVREAEDQLAIEVNFAYSVLDPARTLNVFGARRLRADLTVSQATGVPVWDGRADKLRALFAPGELDLSFELDSLVVMGTTGRYSDAPWYSFDLKGGSFLARPIEEAVRAEESDGLLSPLAGNRAGLPAWKRVDACLETSDGQHYLFDNERLVYRELSEPAEHALAERWGLRYTKVNAEERVDAAWQRGGIWYLSRGDRYLKYSAGLEWADEPGDLGAANERSRDGLPQWPLDAAFTDKSNTTWYFGGKKCVPLSAGNALASEREIADVFGLERNEFSAPKAGEAVVIAAFTRAGRSYLIGPTSYTYYSDAEMKLCERPRPQSLRAILVDLGCTNPQEADDSLRVYAVTESDGELSFRVGPGDDAELYVLKGNTVRKQSAEGRKGPRQLFTFSHRGQSFVGIPGKAGVALQLVGAKERRETNQDVRAVLRGLDGNLYVFGLDSYVQLGPDEGNAGDAADNWAARAAAISSRFGKVRNEFTQSGRVTAAFTRGGATFLVSGDSYVRYSSGDYRFVDAGYPRGFAANPDTLPSVAPDAAIEIGDGKVCYFTGTDHVFSDALAQPRTNASRWGRLRSNLLTRGPNSAYRVDGKHYLFSGNELSIYTAGADGKLPRYMDGAPLQVGAGTFNEVLGAFTYRGFLYLVGRDRFVCCSVDKPEQPLAGYPRSGQLRALCADLREKLGLPPGDDGLAEGRAVAALSLHGTSLFIDTDDHNLGQRVLEFNLQTGQLWRRWDWAGVNWFEQRLEGNIYVDVPSARYRFRGDEVMKTRSGVDVAWGSGTTTSIASLWGSAPFDVAIAFGERVYLFDDGYYTSMSKQEASDGAGLVANIRSAMGRAAPIRGSFSRFPEALLDGFDAALWVTNQLYLFKGAQFTRLPTLPQENASIQYEMVRLTTSTAAYLNEALFAGGLPRLLSLATQVVDETPGFAVDRSGPTTIRVNPKQVRVSSLPRDGQLDFASANGIYLWEIFFHAPFLIADTLSTAQRFEEARSWYEHVFDPTEPAEAWKFLPFLTVDVELLVEQIRDRLARLENAKVDVSAVRGLLAPPSADLLAMDAAFQGERELGSDELAKLSAFGKLPSLLAAPLAPLLALRETELKGLAKDVAELVDMIAALRTRWEAMQASRQAQIDTYLDDPFDPHAIAAERPIAYRKAIVLRYLDNLLDWGDMLFSQYTRESINEARMLYIHASDLLGRRPESLGRRLLSADSAYVGLRDERDGEYDMLLQLKGSLAEDAKLSFSGSVEAEPDASPYFFVPANEELDRYWSRVADRLYKIRHGLNIEGVNQPLALFEPPLDPMALVRAVAGAGSLSGLSEAVVAVEVPHYRFSFLMGKAQALAQKVAGLGAELLSALEKRDAEALSQLQTRQEGIILTLTRDLRRAQLEEARANLLSLRMSRENAVKRRDTYTQWINDGYSGMEVAQIALMSAAAALYGVSATINLGSAIAAGFPKAMLGLFVTGVQSPKASEVLGKGAEAIQTLGEGLQVVGEILGITAQHERTAQDWSLQRDLAKIDIKQIDAQITGAEWQIRGAEQEIVLAEREIEHNATVARFYRTKFSNQELYEWMSGRLSTLHYQSYQLAMSMARAAERAFAFERGSAANGGRFIQGQQWDTQRKGLLAASSLGLDLDRMEAAFIASDTRRFEISKSISLVELDPMAFLKLKTEGVCEFELGEALFDYDFPGHYCRQVKTLSVTLDFGQGTLVNATLTQLTNRVVLEPDPKAVAFLLDPKELPPTSIRSNWKSMQQIALSQVAEQEPNNGLFELRFDNDRFLPFEGTGAVARYRLELGGRAGSYDLAALTNVIVNLKYTALQGGEAFAAAVRGLLKPTQALRAFNLAVDFGDVWQAFLEGDSNTLELGLFPEYFPAMANGRIGAILSHYETRGPGSATFTLENLGQRLPLPDKKTVDTSGLTIQRAGTSLRLGFKGNKAALGNVYLVLAYQAGAK